MKSTAIAKKLLNPSTVSNREFRSVIKAKAFILARKFPATIQTKKLIKDISKFILIVCSILVFTGINKMREVMT